MKPNLRHKIATILEPSSIFLGVGLFFIIPGWVFVSIVGGNNSPVTDKVSLAFVIYLALFLGITGVFIEFFEGH